MDSETNRTNNIKEDSLGIRVVGSTVEFDFSFYISDGEPIGAEMFAEGLKGMEKLLKDSPHAFLRMFGVATYDKKCKSSVLLDEVRPGSKTESLVYRIVFGSDEEANATADKIHHYMKNHPKAVASVVIAAILAWTAVKGISIYSDARSRQPAIEARDSVIVQVGGDINLSPESVRSILSDELPGSTRTLKAAAQVLAPAKRRGGTVVKLGGSNGIEIPDAIVSPMPAPEQIKDEPETMEESFERVKANFVAMDRDRKSRGWAIELPKGFPDEGRRLPAVLAETVNSAELRYAKDAEVDITVIKDSKGKAKSVLIRKLHRTVEAK